MDLRNGFDIKRYIRTIPDYPKPGIMFRDITTLLSNLHGFRAAVDAADGTLTVRLFEYLPDVCECTHRRNVELSLQGLDDVTRLVVFLNAGTEPVAATAI